MWMGAMYISTGHWPMHDQPAKQEPLAVTFDLMKTFGGMLLFHAKAQRRRKVRKAETLCGLSAYLASLRENISQRR